MIFSEFSFGFTSVDLRGQNTVRISFIQNISILKRNEYKVWGYCVFTLI